MKKQHVPIIWLLIVGLYIFCFFPSLTPTYSAETKTKPITRIKIAGGRVGDPWYVLSEATAYFINKKSSWLRATVVATPGITGDLEMAMKSPKDYIAIFDTSNFIHMRKDPYGKPYNYYDKMRFISVAASMTWLWVTYDKNIKSPQDFIGKKINVGRRPAARTPDEISVLKEWGLLDKVKLVHSGYGGAKNSLKDGLVDIACLIFDTVYPDRFSKGAFYTDLETKGPLYYIGMDPDMLDRIRKEGRAGFMPVRVPAGALDPKTQPTELWSANFPTFLGADERMDEAIVYEVTRIIYESAGEFGKWHPQGGHMTKKFIPAVFDVKYVHPGAKKYYDKHGIKVKYLGDLLR